MELVEGYFQFGRSLSGPRSSSAKMVETNFKSCRDLQGPKIWLNISLGEKVDPVQWKISKIFLIFCSEVRMEDGQEGTVGVRGDDHVIKNYSEIISF